MHSIHLRTTERGAQVPHRSVHAIAVKQLSVERQSEQTNHEAVFR
jgi:hypothetical protein